MEDILFAWIKALFFFVPLFISGVAITSFVTIDLNWQRRISIGIFAGVSVYIFLVNIISYIFQPYTSFRIVLIIQSLIALYYLRRVKINPREANMRILLLWLFCMVLGIFLLHWYIGKVNFGGDIELYYSYARTYERGNFPLMAPWQPDLPATYHYGSSILLASMRSLTNLPFEFIHRFVGMVYILCIINFFLWNFWNKSLKNIVTPFVVIMVALINYGTWMFIWPKYPLIFPKINSLSEFLVWLSQLPTASNSYETYGGSVNSLSTMVYFFPTIIALGTLLWSIYLVWNIKYKEKMWAFSIIGLSMLCLSLVNESYFIVSAIPLIFLLLTRNLTSFISVREVFILIPLAVALLFILIFQGGIITDSLFFNSNLEKSVVVMPSKDDFPFESNKIDNIKSYLNNQQSSHFLGSKDEWLPFLWYQVGVLPLYVVSLILLIFFRKYNRETFIYIFTFISIALFSTFAYNLIITKFVIANGNRFLAMSYYFLGISLALGFTYLFYELKNKLLKIFIILVIFWIMVPSTLPSIGQFYLAKGVSNRLKIVNNDYGETIKWLGDNLEYFNRTIDLVENSPFSSRPLLTLREAGIFSPVFNSKYRAYTIEASPEYVDAVYTLNPSTLKELKIAYIVIDSEYYSKLDIERQEQIQNKYYFNEVFRTSYSNNDVWEKVYKVEGKYLDESKDLPGSYKDLLKVIPEGSKVYIDEWKNINPWNSLRKSLIFALRDYKPYFIWGPGVYLNVETYIPAQPAVDGIKYDYLVLFKKSAPLEICSCKTEKIWEGINDNIVVWKVVEYD